MGISIHMQMILLGHLPPNRFLSLTRLRRAAGHDPKSFMRTIIPASQRAKLPSTKWNE
jgi:hypothetical protein